MLSLLIHTAPHGQGAATTRQINYSLTSSTVPGQRLPWAHTLSSPLFYTLLVFQLGEGNFDIIFHAL